MKILVIAPHCDDECYGAGGMIAKAIARGDTVHIAVAACGQPFRSESTQQRQAEMKEALDSLGGAEVHHFEGGDVPEMHLSVKSPIAITSWIDGLLADGYDEVYGPYRSFNTDHQIVHDCLVAALRNTHLPTAPKFVAWYEYPYATMGPEIPGGRCYVDITGEPLRRKLDALSCYKSQLRPWPSQNSLEAVRRLAGIRGMESGCEASERYYIQFMKLD